MKKALLKWLLIISGVVQIGYWGLSHLFFPAWYLRSVGLTALAQNPGSTVVFLNEIGILTVGMGVAAIWAARNPVRYFAIIAVLIFDALGSMAVSFYHIKAGTMASGEWLTIVILGVQLVLFAILFPWRELGKRSSEA